MEPTSWEHLPKHIFILSSSGKPVFCKHGDEQELVTIFGLLQAVISIVQDAGDNIRSIRAGKRQIVYLIRNSLYFIGVSSTGEPEIIIRKQLEFMYSQILLILTSKVHDVLRNNSSKDIRDLLGPETTQLLHAACVNDLVPACIAFQSIRGICLGSDMRSEIQLLMKSCVETSGSALGILLHGDALVSYFVNSLTSNLNLDNADILLLSHFIANSPSLRSHDQNWVPICLPNFNSSAFLQAYICNLRLRDPSNKEISFFLVLIASTADASTFKSLHESRYFFENELNRSPFCGRLFQEWAQTYGAIKKHLSQSMCLHFFFKYRPVNAPSQCIESEFDLSLCAESSMGRIWIAYKRLGVCVRAGTNALEYTVLQSNQENAASNHDCSDNIMSVDPSSDHALSYIVLSTGHVIVGLATSESELYATFPGTVTALDACGLANYLSRSLKADANHLFLVF